MPLVQTSAQRQDEERYKAQRKYDQARDRLRRAEEALAADEVARAETDAVRRRWTVYAYGIYCWWIDCAIAFFVGRSLWVIPVLIALLLWRLVYLIRFVRCYPQHGTLLRWSTVLCVAVFHFSLCRTSHHFAVAVLATLYNAGCTQAFW